MIEKPSNNAFALSMYQRGPRLAGGTVNVVGRSTMSLGIYVVISKVNRSAKKKESQTW